MQAASTSTSERERPIPARSAVPVERRVVVQKYGGSSLASVEKIRAVAAKIAKTHDEGLDLAVVVSAMGNTTDALIELARGVCEAPPAREMDMLLSSGERISTSLLAMALEALGVPAVSLTGPQCGIRTDDAHAAARIVDVRPSRVEEELARGRVVIVAGFQGESPRREITTLGRGGSDASAVALAAALGAERCDIFSDVDGVYTADPRVCPSASRIARLGYDEMCALARQGAKVLNTRSVEIARRDGVIVHARSTFGGDAHTVVAADEPSAGRVVGIAGREDLWRVTASEPAAASRVGELALLARCDALFVRTERPDGLEMVLATEDLPERAALQRELEAAGACVEDELGSVAAVGLGAGEDADIGEAAARALDASGVGVVTRFGANEALAFVVRRARVRDGMRALHAAFCEARADDRRVA